MVLPGIRGRVALVTGGAQGIGAAVVEALRGQGADVVSADLSHVAGLQRAEAAEPSGRGALWTVRLDVAAEAAVVEAVAAITAELGAATIVVHAAGISTMDWVSESNTADWERTNAVNATGSYLLGRESARAMLAAGLPGRIIFLASQAGKNGYRAMGAYVASKHAVLGLTKTMAVELAPKQILVNAICPGIVETDMKRRERVEGGAIRGLSAAEIEAEDNSQVPLGRTAQPEDVANVALFLASGLSSYMTGQGINVTGGMTMH